jgi:hypothetical protein
MNIIPFPSICVLLLSLTNRGTQIPETLRAEVRPQLHNITLTELSFTQGVQGRKLYFKTILLKHSLQADDSKHSQIYVPSTSKLN